MLKLSFLLAFSILVLDVKKVNLIQPISLSGIHLFSVRGASADKRAEIIYDRLRTSLVPSLQPSDITVAKVKDQAVILINDDVLLTITKEDALRNNSNRFALAKKIQKKLQENLPNLVPM